MRTAVRARPWLFALTLSLTATLAQAAERIEMVNIQTGSFMMGSCLPPSDKDRFMGKQAACANPNNDADRNEGLQRRVTLRAFQMGKTEVTLGQFKQFIAAADRSNLISADFMQYNAYGDNAPVVQVSWYDAQAFIKWLNQTQGGGYRLPSEAEWEYACCAGGRHTYCGSDNLDAVGWYDNNSGNWQQAVGRKPANAFGLFDMSGNVWELLEDCRHDDYTGAPSDGSAWISRCTSDGRGLRGGSWYFSATDSRAAIRSKLTPGFRLHVVGFRLARTR